MITVRVDIYKSGISINGGSCLFDFSKVFFRKEVYLDRIFKVSVKFLLIGRII